MSNGTQPQNTAMSDIDKTILTGRIYPAIQSCVKNRYYILLGIFAYYGLILTSDSFEYGNPLANIIVSVIFTLIIIHNFLNYLMNAYDQYKIEHKYSSDTQRPSFTMEIFFMFISLFLVWGAFLTISFIEDYNFPYILDKFE